MARGAVGVKLKVTFERAAGPVDLLIIADAETRVGDVAQALVEMDPESGGGGVASEHLSLCLIGDEWRVVAPENNLSDSGLKSGDRVRVVAVGDGAELSSETTATVRVLDGPDAGKTFPISTGATEIGRAADCDIRLDDDLVSRQHARVVVTRDSVEIADLGSTNGTRLNGEEISRRAWTQGDRLVVGDTTLTIDVGPSMDRNSIPAIHAFNRSPLVDPTYRGVTLTCPIVPEVRRRQRIPMVPAIVTPLALGLIMFVVSKASGSHGLGVASFAFIALSPLMMVTSALDNRWSATRGWRGAKSAFHVELSRLAHDAKDAEAAQIRGRDLEYPGTPACIQAVQDLSPLLWSRRPGEARFLELRLGTASLTSRTEFERRASLNPDAEAERELVEVLSRFASIDCVPAIMPVATAGPFGIAGQNSVVARLMRSLVVQLVTLHSPAEVVLAGFFNPSGVDRWNWVKWAPHVGSSQSPLTTAHLVSGIEGLALLAELESVVRDRQTGSRHASPAVVVIVDDDCTYDRARLVALAESGRSCGVYVVWLAGQVSALPAVCRSFVDLESGVATSALSTPLGSQTKLSEIEGLEVSDAEEVSRKLSPIVDAGALVNDDTDLPRTVSWLELYGADLAHRPEAITERWQESRSILTGPNSSPPTRHRPGTLRALVGQRAGEPHALDLRAHGPHVLLGGTTGAGKSELLQAWILGIAASHSPQRVTFLLVDYKGGSAFSECVNLPHTVGLVTDLNQHLVRRALTSLGAELTYREHLLARKQYKDLLSLEATGDPDTPPSLVIVVDEFAALVAEVPDFVDGVVNVAQRGRSLGLHLILATQRPAGVIRDNLRANTNLRVALRMADDSDSTDVVGSPIAASFDPEIPGRSVSKTGPGRLVPFQAAYAGGHSASERTRPEISIEELVIGAAREWSRFELDAFVEPVGDPGPRDISRVVEAIRRASDSCQLPAPRRPWLPELLPLYDLDKLSSRRCDDELVFGVVDHPERQDQTPAAFEPDRDGNLAIFGTSGAGKSTLLRTIAIAAGLTTRGGPCRVYCLDFGARGLHMLDQLPHVGAVIGADDRDRVTRLLRDLIVELQSRAQRFSSAKAATIADYRRLADRPDEPRLFLLIDGLTAFRQQYENVDSGRWMDALATVMSDGRPLGIHVVLSVDRATSLPARLGSSVQRRVVMRLADDNDYITLGARGILDANSPPGRAVVDGQEAQVAVFGGQSEAFEQSLALEHLDRTMRRAGAPQAPAVATLERDIPLTTLPAEVAGLPVLGVCDDDLAPVGFSPSGVFAVAGPSGSGRTTTCASICAALRRSYPELSAFRFGREPAAFSGFPWTGEAGSPEAAKELAAHIRQSLLGHVFTTGQVVVLVEHFTDFVGSPAEQVMIELLREGLKTKDFFVLSEGTVAEYTRTLSQLTPILRGEHTGIVLQPEQSDGYAMFKINFPRSSRDQFPSGRGYLVSGSSVRLTQIAMPR
jgi:S-DNA-T family DNA segregation ATPase FtsK/SpoIIIE